MHENGRNLNTAIGTEAPNQETVSGNNINNVQGVAMGECKTTANIGTVKEVSALNQNVSDSGRHSKEDGQSGRTITVKIAAEA